MAVAALLRVCELDQAGRVDLGDETNKKEALANEKGKDEEDGEVITQSKLTHSNYEAPSPPPTPS